MKRSLTIVAFLLAHLSYAQQKQPPKTTAPLWKQEPVGFSGFKFGASPSECGLTEEEHHGGYLEAARYRRIIGPVGNVGIELTLMFRDDKLVELNGRFESSRYEELREIFVAAYGRPHQAEQPTERTTGGVTVHNELLSW
ncbi:MAG TPA: hypothetical protein VG897_06720, partial [Terriglobales bacterium]|nr:hypothetical protein [Terriglobales bacterium]